ncbi:photosystem II manganese-stabilizing polypeptide [Leptolyngbya cf. ectocarpi LEGE 11479]|uniref:Photosystem II extrinsic protein O n=1 Tax=Leptolyngbya cf. ectocarpi LEGE 11479 TaxID=1828722 RepID=A0A928ZUN7_LEPEC|nr:photosystem II manganese-stabilizing polypeptide [Leptolyngbya ectocarpi]MBE9067781.1 photosystem II manganese-stabilizing polypeptide [Leptolyngbya cf. ectocarpi LEGE 11479]
MKYRALIPVLLALFVGALTACSSASNLPTDSLSYDDIRNSGLANNCPELSQSSLDAIAINADQSYQLNGLCLQPETFLVRREPLIKRQESKFVLTKPLTRKSFSLDQISGSLEIGNDGNMKFVEQGGFDFQPVTVQLPDGERVPLLFTVKGLVAKNQDAATSLSPSTRLAGNFQVPPYRTSSFIDPKGRGVTVGYEGAMAMPDQTDREDLARPNIKTFEIAEGHISLQINRVNSATGEIAGLFESDQPSDTDFGAKDSMDVKIRGQFYGRIEQPVV